MPHGVNRVREPGGVVLCELAIEEDSVSLRLESEGDCDPVGVWEEFEVECLRIEAKGVEEE